MYLRNFYKFIRIERLITKQKSIKRLGDSLGIKGTILLAEEGINASISAHSDSQILKLQNHIEDLLETEFSPLITDLSEALLQELPFSKFKVRIRPEIITFGEPDLEPSCVTGDFVEPRDWNALIEDPQTLTIDTRNIYEYYLGHFKGATNPETPRFRDFVDYVKKSANFVGSLYKHIALYCTGGIRCEKASSLMKKYDIHNVYQLKGGILSYFQQVKKEDNLWIGSCFVFDDRVAVNTDMSPSRLRFEDLAPQLHKEKTRSRHDGHIYKKIISLTE